MEKKNISILFAGAIAFFGIDGCVKSRINYSPNMSLDRVVIACQEAYNLGEEDNAVLLCNIAVSRGDNESYKTLGNIYYERAVLSMHNTSSFDRNVGVYLEIDRLLLRSAYYFSLYFDNTADESISDMLDTVDFLRYSNRINLWRYYVDHNM